MPGERPEAVSEDCLNLNIWTPARTAHEHLPVMVWLYGGGTSTGRPRCPCTGATGSRKKVSSLSPSLIALARLIFSRFVDKKTAN
jgi:hypothetical protein